MVPPKKKRKVVEPAATEADTEMTDASSSQPPSVVVSMAALDQVLDQFVDSLEDTRHAGNCLLDLKAVQRTCLHQLAAVQDQVEQKHAVLQQHRTTLATVQYEEGHWTSTIESLQASSVTPQLEALCREELDDNLSSAEAVMAKYFDVKEEDLTNNTTTTHQRMMTVLHHEIHQRGTLERDLAQKHKELHNLTLIEKKRAQFLHQLPDKLKDIEKASAPLQRWFQNAQQQQQQAAAASSDDIPPTGLSQHVTYTSSERDARLHLAQTLPGPLYTLLVQLQSYVDDYPHQQMSLEIVPVVSRVVKHKNNTRSGSRLWNDPAAQGVVWQIPIPAVAASASAASSSKPLHKLLSIRFCYFEAHNVVTAQVIGGDDKLVDVACVLQLNPHDTGAYQPPPPVAVEGGKAGEDDNDSNKDDAGKDDPAKDTAAKDEEEGPYGKPYLWCNYLAGLQLLQGQHPHESMRGSTRVIVATLLRQVRANATLTYILHKVLPSYPRASALPPATASSSSAPQCLAKVTSFQLDKDASNNNNNNNNNTKTYKILCKRGNHSLQASVQITASLYPVLAPPQWSLTGNTLQWGQDYGSQEALDGSADPAEAPPLHQSRLAALEARVNDMDGLVEQLLQQQQQQKPTTSSKNTTKEEESPALDSDRDESYYYDWILTHQLREVLVEWDDWVSSGGGDTATTNATASDGGNGRSVRGRDRAKVE